MLQKGGSSQVGGLVPGVGVSVGSFAGVGGWPSQVGGWMGGGGAVEGVGRGVG